MAVETQYVVVRAGVEKMTFASKKEADAYDKLLDMSDELSQLLTSAPVPLDESQCEQLALYLAEHKESLSAILRGAKPAPSEPTNPKRSLKQVA